MKEIKFRWTDKRGINYRSVLLPDNAEQMLYVDKNDTEVYENAIIFEGSSESQIFAEATDYAAEYEDYISLDAVELTRKGEQDNSELYPRIYHEPLKLAGRIGGRMK